MSNEITVQAINAARAGSDTAGEPKADVVAPPPAASPAAASSPIVNPTLRLDAALGLVVIEFRNDSGAITTSIPSQRQLAAYQRWEDTRLGPAPSGRAKQPATAPQPARARATVPSSHQEAKPARTNKSKVA